MKKRMILAAAVGLALSGCATTGSLMPGGLAGSSPVSQDEIDARRDARKEALKGGAKGGTKGCALGGLTGGLLGFLGGDVGSAIAGAKAGCVAGAVTGGISEGVKTYQEQMKQWREFQKASVSVGVPVRIETREVAVQNKATGKIDKTQAGKTMTAPLNAEDVSARGAKTKAFLQRTASLADASKVPVTITVNGKKADRAWLMGELRGDLRKGTTATLREGTGTAPELVLSPAPVVGE